MRTRTEYSTRISPPSNKQGILRGAGTSSYRAHHHHHHLGEEERKKKSFFFSWCIPPSAFFFASPPPSPMMDFGVFDLTHDPDPIVRPSTPIQLRSPCLASSVSVAPAAHPPQSRFQGPRFETFSSLLEVCSKEKRRKSGTDCVGY